MLSPTQMLGYMLFFSHSTYIAGSRHSERRGGGGRVQDRPWVACVKGNPNPRWKSCLYSALPLVAGARPLDWASSTFLSFFFSLYYLRTIQRGPVLNCLLACVLRRQVSRLIPPSLVLLLVSFNYRHLFPQIRISLSLSPPISFLLLLIKQYCMETVR